MNLQDINLMFTYHYWANHLLLSKAAQVTPEQFNAYLKSEFARLSGLVKELGITE